MAYRDNYFDTPEFKDKFKIYEEAVQQGNSVYMEPEDLVDIAEFYHSRDDYKKSLNAVNYAINMFEGATLPLVFRARLALFHENDPDKADSFVEQIDDKTDLDYFYIKAEIMLVKDQVQQADTFFEERMNNIDDEEREDFITDVATLFADYDIFDKAQKWLSMATDQTSAYYKELKGRIALGNGNYEESENIFNELIDGDPFSGPYWNNLASTQFLRNHINESITSSEFSIAINPNDEEAILNKANGLFSLGNYEEALEYYRHFSQLCPEEETGEIFQGIALVNLNRLEEAVEHLKKAEKLSSEQSPNLKEIYKELAFTLSRLGKLNEALHYTNKIEALDKEDKVGIMTLRGHLYLENEHTKEAEECFKYAMLNTKTPSNTVFTIAVSTYDCGFIQLAYKMLHNLLDNMTDDDWNIGYSYLALCCKHLGKTEEFLSSVKQACRCNPEEAKAVLGELFPQDIEPKDYYNFIINYE